MADKRLDAWDRETALRPDLSYAKRDADDVALLWKPEAGDWDMWTCPNSLRDTEVQANLQIVEDRPDLRVGQPAADHARAARPTTAGPTTSRRRGGRGGDRGRAGRGGGAGRASA